MSNFGWSYPAGAANDPNAPYNQDEMPDNQSIKEAFADYIDPYDLYRKVYKYGSCGHSIGFAIYGVWEDADPEAYDPAETRNFYCDDLRQFGTWQDMENDGYYIMGIYVGSIVEGVDQDCETLYVDWAQCDKEPDELAKEFWSACDQVANEANDIWMQTHGCDTCREHWNAEQNGFYGFSEYDDCPVWTECPDCEGSGIVI